MVVSQSQSILAAVSVISCLLLMVLPSSMSSAYRLDKLRNDPMFYKGADLARSDTYDRQWNRNLPLLVSLLRHFYDWERESADWDESPRHKQDSTSQTLRSHQREALLEMFASLSDLSPSIDDVKQDKVLLGDKSPELLSSTESDEDDEVDDSLMTSKLKRGHVYGAVPPLNELCRMMGLNRCN